MIRRQVEVRLNGLISGVDQSMSKINTVPTAVADLEIGMFVTALDRPWIETPFLLEGFYIASEADIEKLEEYCDIVHVDVVRSKVGDGRRASRVIGKTALRRSSLAGSGSSAAMMFRSGALKPVAELFPHRKLKAYADSSDFVQELEQARQAYADVAQAYRDLVEGYRASGRVNASGVRDTVDPLVESMIRNPDGCVWLARNRDGSDHILGHSVGSAVWAVAFGRQMGLPRVDLQRLAIGALLFDIGKLRIPGELLLKPAQLSSAEMQLLKSHVSIGIEMLGDSGVLNRTVRDMVEFHHERHDGHGYPHGLQGEDIPVFGRIAGIVDCYDAITSPRPYAPTMSPSAAVKRLYSWRNMDFQAELVEEFIQAVGTYPAGTLVQLSSGEVGISTSGYRKHRLRPHLLLLLDRDGKPYAEPRSLDLSRHTHDAEGGPVEIVGAIETASRDIDLSRLPF